MAGLWLLIERRNFLEMDLKMILEMQNYVKLQTFMFNQYIKEISQVCTNVAAIS